MKYLLSPFILYSIVWIFVFFLYSLGLSYHLTYMEKETVLLIFGSIAAWFLSAVFYSLARDGKFKLYLHGFDIFRIKQIILEKRNLRRYSYLLVFWLVFSFIEVIYSGNLPLLSLFGIGTYVNYVDFGISGFHGLLNAVYLFISLFTFALYIITKKIRYLYIFIFLILWPILLVKRQLLMSMFVQVLFLYIIFNEIGVKKLIGVLASVLLLIFFFGFVGDLRSGREHLLALAGISFDYPDFLPSGLMWVYLYVTTPLSNVNFNIQDIHPHYFPYHSIMSTFPSFLRGFFQELVNVESNFILVTEAFNVSSFFQSFVLDFGIFFTFILIFLMGLIFTHIFYQSQRRLVFSFLLIVVLHNIVFSVFVNFFTHIVFLFELLVIYLFFYARVLNAK